MCLVGMFKDVYQMKLKTPIAIAENICEPWKPFWTQTNFRIITSSAHRIIRIPIMTINPEALRGVDRLKVMFIPDWSRGNPYQRLLRSGLEQAGVCVSFLHVPSGIFAVNRLLSRNKDCDVIHVHWIDDLIEHVYWNRNPIIVWAKLMLFWLDLTIVRLRGRRLVWTVHNLISHESRSDAIELRARCLLAKACDRMLFHSESARKRVGQLYAMDLRAKSVVIEHGNYIGHYPAARQNAAETRAGFGISGEETVVLFFGAIRAYKGVEKLIPAFLNVQRQDIRLVIAGKPWTEQIRAELERQTGADSRVVRILGYVPEERVSELFSIADVVVVPFERTLTSGSVLLAMSMGKALLLPEDARQLDVVDDDGAVIYGNDAELTTALENLNVEDLKQKGNHNLERMRAADWNGIGARVAAEYRPQERREVTR